MQSSILQKFRELITQFPHLVLKIQFSLKHSNKYKRPWKYTNIIFCKHHMASQCGTNLHILHSFSYMCYKILFLFLTFYSSFVIHCFHHISFFFFLFFILFFFFLFLFFKGTTIQTSWDTAAESLQSSLTLCSPIDGSPPGSPSPGFSRQEHCCCCC